MCEERIPQVNRAFKTEEVICGLNVNLEQRKDRFSDQEMVFMPKVRPCSPFDSALSLSASPKDVESIWKLYSLKAILYQETSATPLYRWSMAAPDG